VSSALELQLAAQIRDAGLPEPRREYRFARPRRFRFDFAWPAAMVAAEVEGGTWVQGRHQRGKGYEGDCVKYNLAASLGWRVYRFTAGMLDRDEAVPVLQEALQP
jgi:hypothetical protein